MTLPKHSFEATSEELAANIDYYVDSLIEGLQSFFVIMPKGSGFVEFSRFQQAYQILRNGTADFEDFSPEKVLTIVQREPLALVVLRTILGFSPPELASVARVTTGIEVDQSSARRLDKRARDGQPLLGRTSAKTQQQVTALVHTAVQHIKKGAPDVSGGVIHRLDKADTREGIRSVVRFAREGVAYEVLLYERLLGRPFATHRDAVSEKVGDVLEDAIQAKLNASRVPHHKTIVAERFEDMDQAPDFLVPDQFRPNVVLEAKLAEDDGTARDKVTRVQHLAELRDQRLRSGVPTFEVIACVDGRGFGIRREDVKKLLISTNGKLFTLQTMEQLVDHTSLKNYRG